MAVDRHTPDTGALMGDMVEAPDRDRGEACPIGDVVSADPADLVSTDDVLEATYMQARTVRARIRGLEAVLRPDHVALVPALADLNHAALVLVSRLDIMSRRQREHPECWRRIVSAVRWLRSSMMGVLARADIYRALACSPSASLAAQLRRLEGLVSMLEYVAGDTASMVKRFSDVAHARRHDAGLAAHSLRWSGVRKGHGWSST